MPVVVESGLSFHLPEGQSFRFQDCAAYKAVGCQSVKEMDFAWVSDGKLFLVEVRSYTQVAATLSLSDFVPSKAQPEPHRFRALVDKITDSVLMMLSVWSETAWGQQLAVELPEQVRTPMPLKLVVAVELPAALAVHLSALRDSLNHRLRGRVAIADVRSVVLIDYTRLVSDPAFSNFVRLAN